ncbi:MAG: hypothetical protein JWM53_1691 [bacterium]|nr:hypothetical protein [bacterium]
MRALAASLVLVAATLARADVSLDAARSSYAPHTPLGPRCDAALAAAQASFRDGSGIDFHVRQWRVLGEYSWSDMCGVWGNYSVELVPDERPAHGWRWISGKHDDGEYHPVHHRGMRRGRGWRATLLVDGDSDGGPADYFVEVFRPAVDICLGSGR